MILNSLNVSESDVPTNLWSLYFLFICFNLSICFCFVVPMRKYYVNQNQCKG